jgi:serine/threonine protein kinase
LVHELLQVNADPHCENQDGVDVLKIASGSTASHPLRSWALSFGAFLGRYHIDSGPPIHRSATCEVVFAMDCHTNTRMALKLMRHRHQFTAEISGRRTDGKMLPSDVVIDVCGWHTPKGYGLTDNVTNRQEERENTPCAHHPQFDDYPFVLVMQCADRSLHDACAKERIAGFRFTEIQQITRDIAQCLQTLHANSVCHGDLKQRNVIRLDGKWILCDMDSATHFNKPVGDKTSTAYCPPELACAKFARGVSTIPSANHSFDVWSFGVLLFEICSGQTLFSQDISNDELIDDLDKTRLCTWLVISDEDLDPVLSSTEWQATDLTTRKLRNKTSADAKNLIRWCLQGVPSLRPSFDEILAHRFLVGVSSSDPRAQPMRYHSFLSHAQADASGTVSTLFHLYKQLGIHAWLDMRQEMLTLQGMRKGVCDSDVFILILSERVLTSWFCQQELLCAIEHRKKIQLIVEKETRFFPFNVETWTRSRGGERTVSVSNHAEPQVVKVNKDEKNPWQQLQTDEELTELLCHAIDDNLPRAITYRRRDFEQEAMMHELCRRNGVVLPILTDATTLTPMSSATDHIQVFVIHNRASSGQMLSEFQRAIAEQDLNITFTFDDASIASADKVLMLLSSGVLTGPPLSHLHQVLSLDQEQQRDSIVAVYSEAAGWAFGCAEQRAASAVVQKCINDHEAITFRPSDPEGPDSHEFPAMFTQTLKKLGVVVGVERTTVVDEFECNEIASLRKETAANRQEIAAKDVEMAANRQEIAAKDVEMAANRQEMAAKDVEMAAKDVEIAAHTTQLEALELELAETAKYLVASHDENTRLQEVLFNPSHTTPPGWTKVISRSTG